MSFLARLARIRTKKQQVVKVAWLGLDHAGKTTIIRQITTGKFDANIKRTLGMNVEEFNSKNVKFVSWDIGGQQTFRSSLWESYMAGSMGIIFVVDSADHERLDEAREELWRYIFSSKEFVSTPLLILANKQDLPVAKKSGEIARALNLHKVITHSYAIFPCSAKTAFNLDESLEWLRQRILDGNLQ